MTFSRKRLALILGALVLVAGIAFLATGGGTPPPAGSAPSPTPEVETIEARDLRFQVDLPVITTTRRLAFATYRRTALGSSALDGSGFEALTPQSFKYMDDVRWSPDGSRAVVKTLGRTVLFDRGRLRNINREIEHAAWAPDNARFAYTFRGVPHVYDVRTRKFTKLTGASVGNGFSWSPDGKRLAAFADVRENPKGGELYLIDVASKETDRTGQRAVVSASWSPDGKRMLVTRSEDGDPRLYRYSPDGGGLKDLSLPALAEKSVWADNDRFYVAAPAEAGSGYLSFETETDDILWAFFGDKKRKVTGFDGAVKAIRLLDDEVVALTPTSIYLVTVDTE